MSQDEEQVKVKGDAAGAAANGYADTGAVKAPEKKAKPSDPLIGTCIAGRYTITDRIGAGGMGTVYKAKQGAVDRDIAIKTLMQAMVDDDSLVQRFHLEAKAASKLVHPNTITVFDFGQHEDLLFIAMEFLSGQPLSSAIRRGPMPPGRAIKVMIQVLASLGEAHKKGIIHRDLKPDNIFLTVVGEERDFVKVLDFGVAKLGGEAHKTLTKAGMIFGTPAYMSPEQARTQPLDPRSDIYALGCILFEMLVGVQPFDADEPVGLLLKHVTAPPPTFAEVRSDLQIPAALEAIVMKALEKDRENRFQSAEDMQATLERVASELQISFGTSVLPMMQASSGSSNPTPVPTSAPDTGSMLNTHQASELLGIGDPILGSQEQDTLAGGIDHVIGEVPLHKESTPSGGVDLKLDLSATLPPGRAELEEQKADQQSKKIFFAAAGVAVFLLFVVAITVAVVITASSGGEDQPEPKDDPVVTAPTDKPEEKPTELDKPDDDDKPQEDVIGVGEPDSGDEPEGETDETAPADKLITMTIDSEPKGGIVFVGKRRIGRAPAKVKHNNGEVLDLIVKKSGYKTFRKELPLAEDGSFVATLEKNEGRERKLPDLPDRPPEKKGDKKPEGEKPKSNDDKKPTGTPAEVPPENIYGD